MSTSRRNFVKGSLAALAAGGLPFTTGAPAHAALTPNKNRPWEDALRDQFLGEKSSEP